MGDVPLRGFVVANRPLLQIERKRDVGNAAPRDRRPDRQVDEAGDVRRPHHTLVEHSHVLKEVIGVDVLLVHRADEVVIRHPRDRQHWGLVEPRIVQAVQQVDRPRARGGEAHSEPACVLRVSACRERGRLFVGQCARDV